MKKRSIITVYKYLVQFNVAISRSSFLALLAVMFSSSEIKLVYDHLYDYLEKNSLLMKYQSGVPKFHSSVTEMLKNTKRWIKDFATGLYYLI